MPSICKFSNTFTSTAFKMTEKYYMDVTDLYLTL